MVGAVCSEYVRLALPYALTHMYTPAANDMWNKLAGHAGRLPKKSEIGHNYTKGVGRQAVQP